MSEVRRRVFVTGLGVVCPLGFDEAELWDRMAAGESAAAPIRAFDTAGLRCTTGYEVDSARLAAALAAASMRAMDRAGDMALLAAGSALKQAGLDKSGDRCGMGVIFGTGVGSTESYFECIERFSRLGGKGLRPSSVPRCMANAMTARLSMQYGLDGPNYVVVSACSSATSTIGIGWRLIRDGYADRVLCGGADAVFDPFVYWGWNQLGVLSANPVPAKACRPFDRGHDGTVLGEGAGALVLESESAATARAARVRGEILGFGESSDARSLTAPDVEGQARAMRAALASAGLAASALGFVNAHGTGTPANDEAEGRSLADVLGADAGRVPVVSNKSCIGHLLGAAGVVETIMSLLCLERRVLLPNLNIEDPAVGAPLWFPAEQVRLERLVCMKNSFGFGGNNAVLVLGDGR